LGNIIKITFIGKKELEEIKMKLISKKLLDKEINVVIKLQLFMQLCTYESTYVFLDHSRKS